MNRDITVLVLNVCDGLAGHETTQFD